MAASPPTVTAIVLNWNGGADNLDCLQTLLASGGDGLEVLFVDNASTDGSPEEVARAFPSVRMIRNPSNLGYCAGNNAGIREALRGDSAWILLCNNDTVFEEGFLTGLLAAAEETGAAIVGPKVLEWSRPGRIWAAGGRFRFGENVTELRGHGRLDDGRLDRRVEVDYVPGCCVLIRRDVFETAGLLEESYFAYMEDVEFCARARRRGFRVLCEPASRIRHKVSQATGGGYTAGRKYLNALNSVRFLRAHGTPRMWLAFWVFDVLALPLAWLVGLPRGRARAVVAKARGIRDGLRGVAAGPPAGLPAAPAGLPGAPAGPHAAPPAARGSGTVAP